MTKKQPVKQEQEATESEGAIQALLKIDEDRYRTLIEYAPEAVFLVDAATGRFLYCNPKGEEFLGYTREELCRLTPVDISPPTTLDGRPTPICGPCHGWGINRIPIVFLFSFGKADNRAK